MIQPINKFVPNVRLKYILGAFFGASLFLGSVFLVGFIVVNAKVLFPGDSEPNLKVIFLSLGAVIAVLCLFKFGVLDTFRAAQLSSKPAFSAIALNEEGIRIGAGLFSGLERSKIISRGEPSVFWKWEQIHEFLVEPARGSGQAFHTEPNFRITAGPTGSLFFIWRKPFREIETRIVNLAKNKLGERLQLNDKVAG